jgi:uncharacterized membrane protein
VLQQLVSIPRFWKMVIVWVRCLYKTCGKSVHYLWTNHSLFVLCIERLELPVMPSFLMCLKLKCSVGFFKKVLIIALIFGLSVCYMFRGKDFSRMETIACFWWIVMFTNSYEYCLFKSEWVKLIPIVKLAQESFEVHI